MADNKTITIYIRKGDTDLKQMLKDISEKNHPDNHYYRMRSESEITKALLEEPLTSEHNRIMGLKTPQKQEKVKEQKAKTN